MGSRFRTFFSPLRVTEAVLVLSVLYIVVWALHPSLLFSSSLVTGGDTGSHLALPAYLKSTGNLFNLTPWYPGWFAGMPAYTYYFVLPDFIAVLLSYVVGFAVAFKFATVLGSLLLPLAAYTFGRLLRAPRPIPLALAMATLPFLFDASFTIDGGNLFSTLAGEYAFSLSLALSLVAIGLFARGMRAGRGYWAAALALSATLAAHVLPYFFVIGAVGVIAAFELLARRGIGDPTDLGLVSGDYARPIRFAVGAGALSMCLSAWWLLPFATSQNFTNSMGYTNDDVSSLHAIFSTLGWFNATGGAGGDRWVLIGAGVALLAAFWLRDRLGMILSTICVASLLAFVYDPQGVIWNERLIPFWYLSTHLLVGWFVGYLGLRYINRPAPPRFITEEVDDETWPISRTSPTERFEKRSLRAVMFVGLLAISSTLPGLLPPVASRLHLATSGNQVSAWSAWNYSGYQGKTSWPEYHGLMDLMGQVGKRYGCGRAMWEYDSGQNRFGTPMALMLMPYWTNNCIDSMEGLFFESSATTPYHFLDQAELSASPSNPQVGLPYPQLNVAKGVAHLQELGVRYFVAFSSSVIAQANADPQLHLIAQSRAWPSPGVHWRIYLIANAPLVQPLTYLPTVNNALVSRTAWLKANVNWWLYANPQTALASSGPANWPRSQHLVKVSIGTSPPVVSNVHVGLQSVSFHVSKIGTPMLVKVSYFPRWQVSGASGPYRVSPNLMVVVPTSNNVLLAYAEGSAVTAGNVITDCTVLIGMYALYSYWKRRRTTAK